MTTERWIVELHRALPGMSYGGAGHTRTVDPDIYTMREYMHGYRLRAKTKGGFFDLTLAQLKALKAAGDLTTEGDWPAAVCY